VPCFPSEGLEHEHFSAQFASSTLVMRRNSMKVAQRSRFFLLIKYKRCLVAFPGTVLAFSLLWLLFGHLLHWQIREEDGCKTYCQSHQTAKRTVDGRRHPTTRVEASGAKKYPSCSGDEKATGAILQFLRDADIGKIKNGASRPPMPDCDDDGGRWRVRGNEGIFYFSFVNFKGVL